PLLFLFACKTGKVKQSKEINSYQVQISLNRTATIEAISTQYADYKIQKARPISRSQAIYLLDLNCTPEKFAQLISLMEEDKQIISVEKVEKKKLENTQSTNNSTNH
ncbi:MAG: hypothetical protein AAF696_33625, partial [Bacteroidota bacterium]